MLSKLFGAAQNFFIRNRKPGVAYLSDFANWANDHAVLTICRHLRERRHFPAAVVQTQRGLRGQIVHVIDRHALLQPGGAAAIHASNRVFLSWFHQDPDVPAAKLAALRALLPEALRRVESVVVPCETTRQALLSLGVPTEKITTIPLGVDTSFFRPPSAVERAAARERFGIAADAICIGSFQKDGEGWGDGNEPKLIKGPDVFLQVIERLRDRGAKLHVLLSGPARGYVRSGLEKLGVPCSHTRLEQFHDILPLYHALDLYLIASRCEGGPLAFCESWATGVPVVSTRVGLPADWIDHGVNGMLHESEDADGLAGSCAKLIEQPELRASVAAAALRAAPQLDWAVLAEKHFTLYFPSSA